MKKPSKLLSIIAAGIFSFSGCAGERILRKGDKFKDYELVNVYSGMVCDKPFLEVDFKDRYYQHYHAKMNNDGTGTITLNGTNYMIKFLDSKIPEERGISLDPVLKNRQDSLFSKED